MEKMQTENSGKTASCLIVVVTYNSRDFILKCLESVFYSVGENWFLTVVDNNSTDGTAGIVLDFMKNISGIGDSGIYRRTVREGTFYSIKNMCLAILKKNEGFAGAVNYAVLDDRLLRSLAACNTGEQVTVDFTYRDAEFLLLVNPDVILEKNTYRILIDSLISNKEAGAVAPLILDYEGSGIQNAGGKILCNFLTSHLTSAENKSRIYSTDYVSGSVFALRTRLFKNAGGFDRGYRPMYFEELDLCLRLKKTGYDCIVNPSVSARHYEAASVKKFSEIFYRHYHKNRLRCAIINSGILYFFKKFVPCELRWLAFSPKEKKEKRALICAYFSNFIFLQYNLYIKLKNHIKAGKIKRF